MKYTVLVAISLYVWAASVLASAVEAEALPSSSLPVAVSGLPIGLKLGDTTDVWVERDTTREHELLLGFCIVGVVYVVLKMYGRGWSGADVVVGISMICIALIVAASAVQDASRVEIVLHRGQGEHNALIITRSNLRGDEWRTFTPMSNVFIEFRQPKETGLPSVDDSEEEDPDFDIFVIGEQDSEVLFSSAYYSEAEAQYRAWTTYLDTYRGPGRYESFVPHHTLNTNPQM